MAAYPPATNFLLPRRIVLPGVLYHVHKAQVRQMHVKVAALSVRFTAAQPPRASPSISLPLMQKTASMVAGEVIATLVE